VQFAKVSVGPYGMYQLTTAKNLIENGNWDMFLRLEKMIELGENNCISDSNPFGLGKMIELGESNCISDSKP